MDTFNYASNTLLTREERQRLIDDEWIGGGNLLRSILRHSKTPESRVVLDSHGKPTYSIAMLSKIANEYSAEYLSRGVKPGDRVAVYIEDTFDYFIHAQSLSQIGALGVMFNSALQPESAIRLLHRTSPVGIVTTSDRKLPEEQLPGSIRWQTTVFRPSSGAIEALDEYSHTPNSPVLIVHSSGTTGDPKPIVHTHASWFAGPRTRLSSYQEHPGDLLLGVQPNSHVGGLMYFAYLLAAGALFVPHGELHGARLPALVSEIGPTTVMGFSHVYSELAATVPEPGTLDPVSAWISMGDALHNGHAAAVLRGCTDNRAAVYDRFGASEFGWGILLQRRGKGNDVPCRAVGRPDAEVQAAVLRTDGSHAAAGEVGLFGARSPSLTAGYWNDEELTRQHSLGDYWLSGDLAVVDETGTFFHLDRSVDSGWHDGIQFYSVLYEECVIDELRSEIEDIAVVLVKGKLHAFVVLADETELSVDSILGKISRIAINIGQPPIEALYRVLPDQLPIGATGKVLKNVLREQLDTILPH